MKPWIAGLLGLLALSVWWLRHEVPVEQNVKRLYNAGQVATVRTGPPLAIPSEIRYTQPVTYGFSGGRLGDNLLSYFHARWIAYRDHVPLVFKPFPRADEFALAGSATEEQAAVEIPYFPEPSMKNREHPFVVDWDDPGFRQEIRRALQPSKNHKLLELPADRITVCVHVRRSAEFAKLQYEYPLKFPPDSYYIEQIRRVARIFENKPLYVFLMTDDANPQELVAQYKKRIPFPNIQWASRAAPPADDLEDFFSIPKFDCLILCDSNFSLIASKLGEYALRISPTHYAKKRGKPRVTGLEIAVNPRYQKVRVSEEKVLICGIARNVERAAAHIMKNAEALGKRFGDYAVLIYENNSTDQTAALYAAWAKQNPHVVVRSEVVPQTALSRTERIADARNALLDMARPYSEFKYLVMVDLDFVSEWPIDQIVRNIERGGDWDAIFANGIYPNGDYYDRYALRTAELPLGPELLGNWWRMQLERGPIQLRGEQRIPVFSAFGGLAIYKTASILPFEYAGTITKDLADYYKRILVSFQGKQLNSHTREYARQLGREPTNNTKSLPLVFVEHSPEEHPHDFRHVTCCEHVPLHAAMALHGHGRFFIDPALIFESQ